MKNIISNIFKKNQKYTFNELSKSKGVEFYKKAKNLIPGGTQLLSKRPEMFAPEIWPSYYSRAKGCEIWDLENRKYIDMSIMAVGACILGYADNDVDEAVIRSIRDGVNSTLNCPEEIQLAEKMIELHPWFGMARYARSGGEAMSIAVRIARAFTGRDCIFFSGYHGWNDWYLSANLKNKDALDDQLMSGLNPEGVPKGLSGTSIPFEPNSIKLLRDKIKGKEKSVAAIVIEPARGEEASTGYLSDLKDLASDIGAVLIFDEITSGFRVCPGGIHRKYKVYPDIAVFAKSMSNGYPMSAIFGKEKVMQACQKTFISSTNWTEKIGPTAALATIEKYIKLDVHEKIIEKGNFVKKIWKEAAIKNNLDISISGLPSLASFSFNNKMSIDLETIFTVEMLKKGILGFRQFKPSLSHHKKDLKIYKIAVNQIFEILNKNNIEELLQSPPHHVGFKRLTKE